MVTEPFLKCLDPPIHSQSYVFKAVDDLLMGGQLTKFTQTLSHIGLF